MQSARNKHQYNKRADQQGRQINRQAPRLLKAGPTQLKRPGRLGAPTCCQARCQLRPAGTNQVKRRAGLATCHVKACLHASAPGNVNRCLRNKHFRSAGVPCNFFHGLRDLLAGAFAVQRKIWQLAQHLQRMADRLNPFAPLNLSDHAQTVDDVADGQVTRHLHRLTHSNQLQPVGAVLRCPAHECGCSVGGVVRHALPQLSQENTLEPNVAEAFKQLIECLLTKRHWRVPHGVGCFARCFTFSNLVCNPAQIFKQHHPERGRQCPQLAQAELTDLLVSI